MDYRIPEESTVPRNDMAPFAFPSSHGQGELKAGESVERKTPPGHLVTQRAEAGEWPCSQHRESAFPLKISLRHTIGGAALTPAIIEMAQELGVFQSRIKQVRVAIDECKTKTGHSHYLRIKITVALAKKLLVVNHDTETSEDDELLYLGIQRAFSAVSRQMRQYFSKKRHKKRKQNPTPVHGHPLLRGIDRHPSPAARP